MECKVKISLISHSSKIPTKAHPEDAGFDLYSRGEVFIRRGERVLLGTGVRMQIPVGWEGQVRPRSGLSKRGVMMVNSPGTIDAGYRGEVGVLLENASDMDFHVMEGDRIAQIVFSKVHEVTLVEGDLDDTERGSGGWGSTGR